MKQNGINFKNIKMNNKEAYELIDGVVKNLVASDAINTIDGFDEQTIVLGNGSVLDSISFITFITDIEDKLQEVTGKELYLVLNEINNFNVDNPNLTVGGLATYLATLSK